MSEIVYDDNGKILEGSLIKYYEDTIEYLKTSKIDNWTYNKAIQKAIESYRISDGKKQELNLELQNSQIN